MAVLLIICKSVSYYLLLLRLIDSKNYRDLRMKILLISDKVIEHIYSISIAERFRDVDFVISCGDLPNYYLDFIVSTLNKPLFYVMGNHNKDKTYTENGIKCAHPEGCINLDNKIIDYNGVLLMGLEGSMKYSGQQYQYTDAQMNWKIMRMMPYLYIKKLFKKRFVDILVTHAPPSGIHDAEDLCHRGFKSFNGFINRYHPKYMVHGHIHLYGTNNKWLTEVAGTKVINAYGYRVIEI